MLIIVLVYSMSLAQPVLEVPLVRVAVLKVRSSDPVTLAVFIRLTSVRVHTLTTLQAVSQG